MAARWGNGNSTKVAKLLISKPDKKEINTQNKKGETALHAAARSSRPKPELIKFLLTKGADPSVIDGSKQTPAEATTHQEIQNLLTIK